MYQAKILVIAFSLILLTFGVAVWANTTELNLNQKMKLKQIDSFEKCASAGYPIQESYPRRCTVPDGGSFTEIIDQTENPDFSPSPSPFFENIGGGEICVNRCGDNFCAMVVCQGSGCPCAESEASCPQDCRFN